MSEDDRAAKAARAKAMLNRRRQQKTGAEPSTSVPQVSPRTDSPTPSEQLESRTRDPAELFSKGESDSSWISSLPQATPPSTRVTQAAPRQSVVQAINGKDESQHGQSTLKPGSGALHVDAGCLKATESKLREVEIALEAELSRSQQSAALYEQERHRLRSLLDNERQTVSLLVSEKSTLATELHRLGDMESKAHEFESLLMEAKKKTSDFQTQVTQLQSENETASERLHRLEAREKDFNEKCRDRERQLQLANGLIAELRKELDDSQRRMRELEDQIQSDDRVERLEESLKNTQDRADELEFQLSKLRQMQTTLKSERDELEQQYTTLLERESDLVQKNVTSQDECTRAMQELAEVTSERDGLVSEKFSLQSRVDKADISIQELRRMLNQASSELAIQTRQLQTLQGDLRTATRRADEAEKIQKDLQLEGTNLMRSLDEMRPKIVELTSEKLNLTEKAESLEQELQDRNDTINELEYSLNDSRSQIDQTNEQWQQKWSWLDNKHAEAIAASSDMQKAHVELQDQLDNALQSLHGLESQRVAQHQEIIQKSSEIEGLNATVASQKDELSTLKKSLEVQRIAQDQRGELPDHEIETLRSQLHVQEEECERLQGHAITSRESHSLNDEFIATLRQQHALDLSAAHSQIRALEDSVFNAEANGHTLQKQIVFLEEQLKLVRSTSHNSRSFSPVPSRPASRNELDLHRSSFSSHRTSNLAASPLSRAVLDQELSPETQNKRKISLTMLKARIESEIAAQPPSRALSPVHSLPSNSSRPQSPVIDTVGFRRPQFMDDSHVFWCSACHGDLVIL